MTPPSVSARVAALGLRVIAGGTHDPEAVERMARDLAHVDAAMLDRVAATLGAVPDAHVLDLLTTEATADVAATLTAHPTVAGMLEPSAHLPRRAPQRFAALAFALGAALLHVEGVLERRSGAA